MIEAVFNLNTRWGKRKEIENQLDADMVLLNQLAERMLIPTQFTAIKAVWNTFGDWPQPDYYCYDACIEVARVTGNKTIELKINLTVENGH